MCRRWVVVVVVLLGQWRAALALEPDRSLSQYVRATWTVDRGLPQGTIHGVAQTPDGYIWIATQEGLVRFDGFDFVTYDKNSHAEILSNLVICIRVTRDGTLYAGTVDGGLIRMRGDRIDVLTEANGLPSNNVRVLHEASDGTLWIGTTAGLARFSGGSIQTIPAAQLPAPTITALAEDATRQLWVGTAGGIVTIRNGEVRPRTAAEGFPVEGVKSLTVARDGSLWIGTDGDGLFRVHSGRIERHGARQGVVSTRVTAVYEDRRGTIWIGTQDHGFGRLRGGGAEFDREQRDPVIAFFEDREGNLWIGRSGSLDQLTDGAVITYSETDGLLDDDIKSVTADRDGTIWAATRRGITDLSGRQRLSIQEGLSSSYVLSAWAARDGSLWIGTADGGLNHVRNGRITHYTVRDGLPDNGVLALYEDSRGVMWVGTIQGLVTVAGGKVVRDGRAQKFPPVSISVIFETRDGSMWVGTHEHGVIRIRADGTMQTLSTLNGLSHDFAISLHEDASGALWIGTAGGGLNRWKNGRLTAITSRDGLQDDSVFAILEDSRGNLWMSSNKGIFRASLSSLNAVADGLQKRLSSVMYGRSDGMKSRECNGGTHPAAWKSRDNRLWFATTGGVAMIDPERALVAAPAAPVAIGGILVDQEELSLGSEVPPGHRTINIHYTSPTFRAPDKLRFRYKLEGFDDEWIDAQTRRVAYYTNVPPGSYAFRVTAVNPDGIPAPETTTRLTVQPFYYQTPLFWLAVAAVVLSIAWWILRWRIRLIRASADRFKLLFDRNLAGVYRAAIDGRILDCNPAFLRVLGLDSPSELEHRTIFDFFANREDADELLRRLREQGAASGVETAFRRNDGKRMWVLQNVSLAKSEQGQDILEATVIDLSDRKEAEERIRYLAYHDGLTDLPNRALFKDRLGLAIRHTVRRGRKVGVLFLDLDRFKLINDTLGHTIGDHLLQGMAERLKSCVREEDSVARVGGDEFTILLMDLGRPGDAMSVAQKVIDTVAQPMLVDGHELFVTCSIGIAMSPDDGLDAEVLLMNADNALYRAKEAGKNNYQLCTPSMTQLAAERLAVENALRQALDRSEFLVVYQPQYDLGTRKVVAVEALLRWNRPGTGIVGPSDFIAAAEESRLIVPIGEWVLDTALQQAREWSAETPVRVAVNVSAAQFRQRHLVRAVRNALQEYSVDPKQLEIEITESTAMQNPAVTAEILAELKDLGVTIVIDDFGIGHSSLNYLKRFPIDGLKIDKTFVQDMISDGSDAGIVSAVIAMAQALNLRVTAEGVETDEQLQFLERRGCTAVQGYLVSRPVNAGALTSMLRSGEVWSSGSLPHTA